MQPPQFLKVSTCQTRLSEISLPPPHAFLMAGFEGAVSDVFSTFGRRAEVTLSTDSISAFLFFCLCAAAAAAAQPCLRLVQICLRTPADIRLLPAVRVDGGD